MNKRHHPKVGDLWVNRDATIAFTVLDKEYDRILKKWILTLIITGAPTAEKASFDREFKELEGGYWMRL